MALLAIVGGCSLWVEDGLRGPGAGPEGGVDPADALLVRDGTAPTLDATPNPAFDRGLRDARPADAGPRDARIGDDAQTLDGGPSFDAASDAAGRDGRLPDLRPADSEPDGPRSDLAGPDGGPPDGEVADSFEQDSLLPDAFVPPADVRGFCTTACDHITRCLNGPACPGLWVANTRAGHADCLDTCAPDATFDGLARTACEALPAALDAAGLRWADGCATPDPCRAFAETQVRCASFACRQLTDHGAEVLRLLEWRCHRALASGALNPEQVALMSALPCIDPQWVATNLGLGSQRRELGDWCNRRRLDVPPADCAPVCATAAVCLPPDDLRSDAALCEGLCRADWQHEGLHECLVESRDCGEARACGAEHPYQAP